MDELETQRIIAEYVRSLPNPRPPRRKSIAEQILKVEPLPVSAIMMYDAETPPKWCVIILEEHD